MARRELHIVPEHQSGRDIKISRAERTLMHCDTKAEAIDHARDISKNHVSECVIHRRDGKIQDSDSYGNDPLPSGDKKERHVIPDSKGGWIVTRRGYVVPLEKGKEGIHKKFDEILSTAPD